jgi:hypothetical protein
MDWGKIFGWINNSNVIPNLFNILSTGVNALRAPIGIGMQAKGYDRIFQGIDRKHDAWKQKYDDERRLMNEYNAKVHDIWGQRQALQTGEIGRQNRIQADREAAFEASMNKERDLPSDIEAQFLDTLNKYQDVPAAPTTTTTVDTEAPSIVSENLAAALAKESAKTGTRQAAKARLLAPGLAQTGANLAQADQASLLKSLGGRGLDSAQVAAKEQMLFEPAQLYPTQYTGIDPRADKDLAYGQMLVGMGDRITPSWDSMFSSMGKTFSSMGNAMFPQQQLSPINRQIASGRYGSFPTWSANDPRMAALAPKLGNPYYTYGP